jgi:hypothetical protein
MAGWHVNNEPFALSSGHPLKRIRHLCMMPTRYKYRPCHTHEVQELNSAFFYALQALKDF